METAFTPFMSLFGGALIGLAAVLLMASLGRIAGATGILAGAMLGPNDRAWRIAFVIGMISGPLIYLLLFGAPVELSVPVSRAVLIVGAVLVGIGVTLGNGCTSGHGVCGLARFSGRSLVATATFMAVTTVTVYITRHVIGV